jgi:cytoskeleton protein RodZ
MSGAPGSANQNADSASWLRRLREARERRGLDRQQIAEDLHVDEQTIAALEAGEFTSLGAPVFARGHLRQYAALLGMDVDEVVSALERDGAQPPELVPLTPSTSLRPELPVKWLGAATVSAMVLGVAWWALIKREVPVESHAQAVPSEAGPTVSEPVASEESLPAAPKPAGAAPEPAAIEPTPTPPAAEPTVEESAAAVAVRGTAVSLRLNFSADSWVELYDAGGQRVFFDMGSAATVRDVKAAAPLKVFLGYADGVQLELNGQPLVLPAEVRRGNVARFTVDASGQVKRSKG